MVQNLELHLAMTWQFPDIPTLVKRTANDMEAMLEGSNALILGTERFIAEAYVGAVYENYEQGKILERDLLPLPGCSEKTVFRWGATLNVKRKDPGYASGIITLTGVNGVVVPLGTIFSIPNGTLFETLAEVVIAGGTANVAVRAQTTGPKGNAPSPTTLTLVSFVADLDTNATALAGLSGGVDEEDIEAWRRRIVARLQSGPLYGKKGDYALWALEVAGVTRAWEYYGWNGSESILVIFVMDGQDPITPNGAKITEVEDYLNTVAPHPMVVTADAPEFYEIDLSIEIYPDTAAMRAKVTQSIISFFNTNDNFNPGEPFRKSSIEKAIDATTGLQWRKVHIPVDDVPLSYNQLPVPGLISFV